MWKTLLHLFFKNLLFQRSDYFFCWNVLFQWKADDFIKSQFGGSMFFF